MFSLEPRKPKTDPYSQTETLYHSNAGCVELIEVNKTEWIAVSDLCFCPFSSCSPTTLLSFGPNPSAGGHDDSHNSPPDLSDP